MDRRKVSRILSLLPKGSAGMQSWNLEDPFKILISTVLSQRNRDESTEKAASQLFSRYRTPRQLASAPLGEIESRIRQSGFYRTKARRIKEIARILLEKYGGTVPADMDALLALPGVGRKTAGCVLVYGFGLPAIPVDTHVHRISNRIGFVMAKTPERTERKLMELIPKSGWIGLNNSLVRFGQTVCRPIGPRCWECPVQKLCEHDEKNLKPRH